MAQQAGSIMVRSSDASGEQGGDGGAFDYAPFGSGSGQAVPLEDFDSRGEIRIAGQSGDVFMFSSNHLHASAPNTSV